MTFAYLGALLFSLAGVVLLDVRHRLFLGRAPRDAAIVLAIGVVFFLLWDVAGIVFGVFTRGMSDYMTGIVLAPEMPLEEPIFLLFLCELTMVLVTGFGEILRRRQERRQ